MPVDFARDVCVVLIYTKQFPSTPSVIDTQFVYFIHCFAPCTVLFNQGVYERPKPLSQVKSVYAMTVLICEMSMSSLEK